MGADIRSLLCEKSLTQLRKHLWKQAWLNFGAVGVPMLVFLFICANEQKSVLERIMFGNCMDDMDSILTKALCLSWKGVLPLAKVLILPFEASYNFYKGDAILGVSRGTILVILLVISSAAVTSGSVYADYRSKTLHFKYAIRTRHSSGNTGAYDPHDYDQANKLEKVCLTEDTTGIDESKGLACNPGMAGSKLGQLSAVLAMLKKFVRGEACQEGGGQMTHLSHLKVHVNIVVKRILERTKAWSFIQRCMATSITVAMSIVTLQGANTVSREMLMSKSALGTRFVTMAFVTFAVAMLALVGATVNIALRRHQMKEQAIKERFSKLYAKVDACTSADDKCRKGIKEALGEGDMIFGNEVLHTPSQFSPRLLAAALAMASIVTLVYVVYSMGLFTTSKGIRALHSTKMRDYASGDVILRTTGDDLVKAVRSKKAYLGGGAPMSSSKFSARLKVIEGMIGSRIPETHVIGWSLALTILSITIAVTGWYEMASTLDTM